jgi:hypothetical protein
VNFATTSARIENWLPLNMLPKVAALLDAQFTDAVQFLTHWGLPSKREELISNGNIRRVAVIYRQRRALLKAHEAQIARWRTGLLSVGQKKELERVQGRLVDLEGHFSSIIQLTAHALEKAS